MFCSQCGAENPEGAKFCSTCGAELGVAATPTEGTAKPEAESSTGMSANVAGLLCYVAGWITGIVFIVLEKKSIFVKFHAWQSIMVFGVLTVAHLILSTILRAIAVATFSPGLAIFAGVIGTIIWILMAILWIILIIQAGTGKMWKVPLAGDWAEKQISK
ncbi:MAG: zinc-ribbon domain-containing protein [Chloroflexota bacterium]|nr:zinc-ribbon domain-containing protein [Chloroflexota bacterium]